ncbi:hypothetical protein SESBI_01010 [Sesbania bispinosa]|nr:hypothetical protein SESBI_01010 [Sesbania bispinosa]
MQDEMKTLFKKIANQKEHNSLTLNTLKWQYINSFRRKTTLHHRNYLKIIKGNCEKINMLNQPMNIRIRLMEDHH